MLTYLDVHLRYVIPPILALGLVYSPLLGRRDVVKIVWLALMATLWTTPWDNYIISRSTWTYPPHRVLFTIGHVPVEEHAFFILQPVLMGLLHSICTLGRLIPFGLPGSESESVSRRRKNERSVGSEGKGQGKKIESKNEEEMFDLNQADRLVQTLPRRPIAALVWISITILGFSLLLLPTPSSTTTSSIFPSFDPIQHPTPTQNQTFYLALILIWISPVIAILTYLGGKGFGTRGDLVAWVGGTGWLWVVDTIAIRDGAWHISAGTSTGWFVWKGLPVEEALFFCLTNYLLVLSCSLISHLHILLLLSPRTQTSSPCPPRSFLSHIRLLCTLVLHPPPIPHGVLLSLRLGENTLRKGSKSFDWAKLWWTREMRCALVATYGWCRITDDLIDDAGEEGEARVALGMMKAFLDESYAAKEDGGLEGGKRMREILDRLPEKARPACYLFDKMLPRLIPRKAFDDLLKGYEMDLQFPSPPNSKDGVPDRPYRTPIRNQEDLLLYADCVAGSVADMICHLSWAILKDGDLKQDTPERRTILERARQMGQALQLVNIARDIRTDAALYRVYIPMDSFGPDPEKLRDLLACSSDLSVKEWTRPLLDTAYALREGAAGDIDRLPRAARAGTRAMVASYFEIGEEVRRRGGELGPLRIKVSKWRRLGAVLASRSIL